MQIRFGGTKRWKRQKSKDRRLEVNFSPEYQTHASFQLINMDMNLQCKDSLHSLAFNTDFTKLSWPWLRSSSLKGSATHATQQQSRKFKRVLSKDKEQALSLKWLYCSNSIPFLKYKHRYQASRILLQHFWGNIIINKSLCQPNYIPLTMTATAYHSNNGEKKEWGYGRFCKIPAFIIKVMW